MSDKTRKPVMLIIMDGWGMADPGPANAIGLADTPVFDEFVKTRPNTVIAAHGKSVGLPEGQMGNSEVGHLNLGAGRVVKQDLVEIDDSIANGSILTNEAIAQLVDKVKASGGKVHLMGLCSPGGVHSALPHLYAVVDVLYKAGLEVRLHAITDGRDTPPSSARGYLKDIESNIKGKAKVAAVVGRFWSMDRDKRWDRVQKGYHAHVEGVGHKHATADEGIAAAYEAGETDEFIEPRIMVNENGAPIGKIEDGDGVFFFNFRADRAREITQALAFEDFDGFERNTVPKLASYITMTEYQANFGLPSAYPKRPMQNILGKVLEDNKLTQFRCAETEKYAHVTFFFNGGVEEPFAKEERKLIPSPQEVATYDLKPEMSAALVGDAVVARIDSADDDFILVNFANPDMVGHTGFIEAAVKAAGVVDTQLGRLCEAILQKDGAVLVTADHGNSEQMVDPITGAPHTAHTLNPVPLILVDNQNKDVTLQVGGALEDVAPTILELMGVVQPKDMTGKSLIVK